MGLPRNPRLAYQNLTLLSQVSYLASSYDPNYPAVYIRDTLLTKVWRSLIGWNVVVGFNDVFDFYEGGLPKLAVLAAGNYPTGAAYAAMLTSAMNAAAIANTYLVSYAPATGLFTVARATGSATFSMELSQPSGNTCAPDLGFVVGGSDAVNQTTYTAPNPAYHTREWLRVNLGSPLGVNLAIVTGHAPLATNGSIVVAGNSVDLWVIVPAAGGPYPLAGDNRIQIAFLGGASAPVTQAFQYWRVLVNDVSNPLGYSQLGIVFLGTYLQPARSFSAGYNRVLEDLSLVDRGDHGSVFQDQRATGEHFIVTWTRLNNLDYAGLEGAYKYLGVGRPFFFVTDPLNQPVSSTFYCWLTKPLSATQAVGDGDPPERFTSVFDAQEVCQ